MVKKYQRYIQLDLFTQPKTEYSIIWDAIENIKSSQGAVRRKLFQELHNIQNSIAELRTQQKLLAFKMNEIDQYNFMEQLNKAQ